MTFKPTVFLLCGLLWICSAGYAAEQKDSYSPELFGVTRPFLQRSDFARHGVINNLIKNSKKPGYDLQGYPKFQRVYATYNLHFQETDLAQASDYARRLNRRIQSYVLQHPEKFSAETVANYSQGWTYYNPKTVDGTPLEWHHDGKHRFLLVEQGEHHSKPHVGGNQTWGAEYAKASAKQQVANREIILTAQRWMKFTAMELVWSNVALMTSHEKDYRTYAVNAFASAGSGFLAWSIESLAIKSFPLLVGTTPYFINLPMNMGVLPASVGGPASWMASLAFIVTKTVIMAGWKKYQVTEALEIEKSCRYAEHFVVISSLKEAGRNNSKLLLQIIENN